jgi:hypothetical protein
MNTEERLENGEHEHPSREQVIAAFRKFIERGITNPDELDLNDPEVIEANRILDGWDADIHKEAKEAGTEEADLEYSLNRSTVLTDAGFSDPEYLDEVAKDWLLENDLARAQGLGLDELAARIQAKIDEINARLEQ